MRRQAVGWASGLAAVLVACPAAQACELGPADGTLLTSPGLSLAWRPDPPIQVSRPFDVLLAACPGTWRVLQVDAHMPEHRHGMNYRPAVQVVAPGRWRATGLVWHMPGVWVLRIEVALDGERRWLSHTVNLP